MGVRSKLIILTLELLGISVLIVINFFVITAGKNTKDQKQVLTSQRITSRSLNSTASSPPKQYSNDQIPSVLSFTPQPIPTSNPTPKKSTYSIAVIGDSMVETMGENLDYLDNEMKRRYPETKFNFYNYGIGSENVEEAIARFDEPFNIGNRNYPAIKDINPDILIVGSYSYNPIYPYDKNLQQLKLSELLIKAKSINTQVYLLAEIAPLNDDFGVGIGGIDWEASKRLEHAKIILEELTTLESLAKAINVSFIDVFSKTRNENGYGIKTYVGSHDGIHPSIEGQKLTAEIIAEIIKPD